MGATGEDREFDFVRCLAVTSPLGPFLFVNLPAKTVAVVFFVVTDKDYTYRIGAHRIAVSDIRSGGIDGK